jgi:long-subunit fatty acid transport protein
MRILTAAALLAPLSALAGGYAIPNENARDLGLSQADVAAQTGPEAAKQNIAALAGQEGLGISASLEMLYNRTNWSDPTLGSASLQPRANFPPEIAVAWGSRLPNGMPYGVGVAFLVPGGGSLIWPSHWAGSGRIQSVDQKAFLWQGGFALQPIEWVKVGASLLYYRVQESLSQEINLISSTVLASLGLSGHRLSYGLSGEFNVPGIPLTFGIDYRHQAPMTLSGHAHFDNVPASFASALQDQAATEQITLPNDLYLGAAYDVVPNVKVMGSWNLERWRVYRSDTYLGDKGLVITVPREYHNAWVYRLGVEYTQPSFLPALTLRAGALRSVSDQPGAFVSPTLTDGKSWAFSVGAGYEIIQGLRVDAAYQFALFDKVTATGVEAFPGSYDTHVHLISAGVTWRPKL